MKLYLAPLPCSTPLLFSVYPTMLASHFRCLRTPWWVCAPLWLTITDHPSLGLAGPIILAPL